MDIINFQQWDDIRAHLNGYALKEAMIDGSGNIIAKTDAGNVMLAEAVMNFWEPIEGPAYSSMDLILSEAKDLVKESGDYSRANKEKILINLINQKVVPLFHKYKK